LDRILRIKDLQDEKSVIAERIIIRNEKDVVVCRIGKELTEETKKDFKVTDIKVLLKWKLEKNTTENRQYLLTQYFDAPDPSHVFPWYSVQEIKLLRLNEENISMRETAVAVSMNQMAQGVINHVDLLNLPERDKLLQSLTMIMV